MIKLGKSETNWKTELQRILDREALATMDLIKAEDALQVTQNDHSTGLRFGPYGQSPISGLHFDTSDDTAAS